MKLPASFRPPQHYRPSFEEAFCHLPISAFGLLTTLLALDPTSCGSAASALRSELFASTRTKDDVHQGQKQIIKQTSEDIDSNKEEKKAEAQTQGQEIGYGGSRGSSSFTTSRNDRNSDASSSLVARSDQKRAPKTEVHLNALKNIKNPTLLQASIRDIIIPNQGKVLPYYRRSISSIDFRSLDPEKIPKLFEFDKK